jgi:hypothetical protein
MSNTKPLEPVKPVGLELISIYPCPFCERRVPMMAPTTPGMGQCDSCQRRFPVVPVDARCVDFLKTMTCGGKANIDPDYL